MRSPLVSTAANGQTWAFTPEPSQDRLNQWNIHEEPCHWKELVVKCRSNDYVQNNQVRQMSDVTECTCRPMRCEETEPFTLCTQCWNLARCDCHSSNTCIACHETEGSTCPSIKRAYGRSYRIGVDVIRGPQSTSGDRAVERFYNNGDTVEQIAAINEKSFGYYDRQTKCCFVWEMPKMSQ